MEHYPKVNIILDNHNNSVYLNLLRSTYSSSTISVCIGYGPIRKEGLENAQKTLEIALDNVKRLLSES